jgi:hypothetical protein
MSPFDHPPNNFLGVPRCARHDSPALNAELLQLHGKQTTAMNATPTSEWGIWSLRSSTNEQAELTTS